MGRILKDISDLLEPPSPSVVLKTGIRDTLAAFLSKYYIRDNESVRVLIKGQVDQIQAHRPRAKREYDQFLATEETLIKRTQFLLESGELLHRNILFLGDDDHTSIAISSIAKDVSITVLDIDQDILLSIDDLAKKHQYRISQVLHDVRKPLPADLSHRFDAVFTDPPYTPEGIDLFLHQAICALKKKPTSRLYFCYGNSDRARERELNIQSIVAKKGLLIKEKQYQFNTYNGAESIGSKSSLFVCTLTPQTASKMPAGNDIYTHS
jgi:predicted methyltransferase